MFYVTSVLMWCALLMYTCKVSICQMYLCECVGVCMHVYTYVSCLYVFDGILRVQAARPWQLIHLCVSSIYLYSSPTPHFIYLVIYFSRSKSQYMSLLLYNLCPPPLTYTHTHTQTLLSQSNPYFFQ
jgi:hypothetical protein